MIKIHPIQIILFLSCVSLAAFFGFSVFVNHISEKHQREIQKVEREHEHAAERLEITRRQKMRHKRRADSLGIIVEATQREEILWTARAIYSETRRVNEMWYVAWVIRNRVESRFHGYRSYKRVILHPKQFSAFNRGSHLRSFYMSLEPKQAVSRSRWHDALNIAKAVVDAPLAYNPLPEDTYHFYSEISMTGKKHPSWRWELTQVGVEPIPDERFRFFRGTHLSSATTTKSAR